MRIIKIGVCVLLLFLLIPLVSAVSKPVAGKIDFTGRVEQLDVNIYVEIDSPFDESKLDCIVNPAIQNGPDGSFSSNLENLILKGFPSIRCNSFWKANDLIWFETEYGGNTYTSTKQNLNFGTGLQLLQSMEIETPEEAVPSIPTESGSAGSGGSGGGGGAGSILITKPEEKEEKKEVPKEEEKVGVEPEEPQINTILNISQNENRIEAITSIELLNDMKSDVILKLVLFSIPNNYLVKTIEDQFLLDGVIHKKYLIDADDLDVGKYKLQALIYVKGKIHSTSNFEEFIIKRNFYPENEEKTMVEQMAANLQMFPLHFIASFIIILIAIYLILSRMKKEKDQR
ncbi:MAG: hypothetical protein ABH824_05605 [Nanoarchaeota archaeon]|nr:hypothetical protein [Nanoarchaeota archaeon]MBU1632323.1 hypothetical protein [Nanoarchaeota archaeon]